MRKLVSDSGSLWLIVLLLLIGPAAPTLAGAIEGLEPAHLALTDCPSEPGCPALVLLDEWELDNESNRTHYTRRRLTKVFTQEGIDRYATVEAEAQVGGWDIRNFSGRTILPDGTTVKLDQDNVHVKVLRRGKRHVKVNSAAFPAVEPGAIIEYSYDIVTRTRSFITEVTWEIQQELPVLRSRFTLKQGKFDLDATPAGRPIEVEHTHPFKNVDYYIAENVPSLPDEPHGPPSEALRARYYFGLPGLKARWLGTLAARYAGLTGKYVETSPEVQSKVAELAGSARSPSAKIRAIYRFIQEEIGSEERRADDTEDGGDPGDRAGAILSRGYGNEFERTMLFLAMAKAAGFDPGFLLIVSRYNGVLDTETPDESQFDSYAAGVRTGSGWKFYDPAVRHCRIGTVSAEKESHVENALLLEPNKSYARTVEAVFQNLRVETYESAPYAVATVPFSRASKNLLRIEAKVDLSPDGTAILHGRRKGTGHADLEIRSDYEHLEEDERAERLQKELRRRFPRAELISADFRDIASFEDKARIEYELSIPEFASVVGDRILIPTSVFPHSSLPNPFTAESRKTDIHFPYPRAVREKVKIEIPDGYVVDSLPEGGFEVDDPLLLKTTYSEGVGSINLSRTLNIDTGVWPSSDYDRLKSFFEKMQEADQQVIVLRRMSSEDAGS